MRTFASALLPNWRLDHENSLLELMLGDTRFQRRVKEWIKTLQKVYTNPLNERQKEECQEQSRTRRDPGVTCGQEDLETF